MLSCELDGGKTEARQWTGHIKGQLLPRVLHTASPELKTSFVNNLRYSENSSP